MTAPRVPLSHSGGLETEHASAFSMVKEAQSMRAVVLELFALRRTAVLGGLTDDEGAHLLRYRGYPNADRLTFGRRRHELALDGLVEDSDLRRSTPTGRMAVVWRLTEPRGFSDDVIDRALDCFGKVGYGVPVADEDETR